MGRLTLLRNTYSMNTASIHALLMQRGLAKGMARRTAFLIRMPGALVRGQHSEARKNLRACREAVHAIEAVSAASPRPTDQV
jgi:hypothetical protein